MKVKIGKYPKWWTSNIYSMFMTWRYKCELFNYPENQDWLDDMVEKLGDLLQTVYNYTVNKRSQELKVDVVIHDYDVWSMDHTLAHIVLPMLKKLKVSKQGAPCVDDDDVPDHLKSENSNKVGYEVDDNWFKRWDYVMDEMIFAFESKTNDWEEQFYQDDPYTPIDKQAMKDYSDRMENGFRLFGKYYQGLWS